MKKTFLSLWILAGLVAGPVAPVRAAEGGAAGGAKSDTAGALAAAPDPQGLAEAIEKALHAARPVEGAGAYEAGNPGHGLSARFGGEGLSLRVRPSGGGGALRSEWRTVALGYGENLEAVPAGEVKSEGNRVEIRREGVVEWFVNRPGGLEHGWTLPEAPGANPGKEPLVVELSLSGDLAAEVGEAGQEVILRDATGAEALRYRKLKVWDATGRVLASRMTGGGDRLSVEVEESGATYPLTIDPVFTQEAFIKASNAGTGDQFGGIGAVAIDGTTVVVGAALEDSSATGVNGNGALNDLTDSGAAYVFVYDENDGWIQQAYLKASNPGADDRFGAYVAIDGNTIVVGAFFEDSNATGVNGDGANNASSNSGAAYVFFRSGSTWTQQAYLKASNTGSGDLFGVGLAIAGDTIAVGAQEEDSNATGFNGDGSNNSAANSGAVYVFTRSGTTWSQQGYLKASNTGSGDRFGIELDLDGETLAVSASHEDGSSTSDGTPMGSDDAVADSGATYVFIRSGTTWAQQAYLKAFGNLGAGDGGYRCKVALSGNLLAVGRPNEDGSVGGIDSPDDNSLTNSGAIYTYLRSDTTWSALSKIKASITGSGAVFGYYFDLDGFNLVSNRSGANNVDHYSFDNVSGEWSFVQTVTGKALEVALSGELLVTSDRLDSHGGSAIVNGPDNGVVDSLAPESGAVFIYRLLDDPIGKLSALKPFKKTQLKKKSKSQILTISNLGEAPLTGSKLGLTGKAAKDFKLIGVPAASIDGGASSSVKILFKPRKVGSRKATVNLTSNAALVSTLAKGKAVATASKK